MRGSVKGSLRGSGSGAGLCGGLGWQGRARGRTTRRQRLVLGCGVGSCARACSLCSPVPSAATFLRLPTHPTPPTHPFYARAQVRTLVQQEMVAALGRCDALLSPAAPSAAYKLGEKSSDPLAMYKGDLMTVNVNLAGLPALVLPAGFVPGSAEGGAELPIGLQLVGRAFDEAGLLGLGYAYEQTAGVPARRAPLAAVA